MAATEDRDTLGRARLSFAGRRTSTNSSTCSAASSGERSDPTNGARSGWCAAPTASVRPPTRSMLRVKVPQGVLDVQQLEAMAEVAERYSRGFGHITTRQNIQLHFVKLHDVELAMRRLAEAGLTTREACGNSVRNITACPYSGVAADEAFDVTPYAEALTRYLLRHTLSACLPRKFKIAFEGCTHDHIAAAINDIGWTARVRTVDGRSERGFRVTVAGGTATLTRSGNELFEFAPVGEMFNIAEAIVRVFHRLGDYKHKQRNRLKFLVAVARVGRVQGGIRQGARGVPAGGRRAPAVRARESAGGRSSGGARQRTRGGRHRRGGHERKGHRARDRSACRARPTRRERTR